MAARGNTSEDRPARLSLRLAALASQAFILRAHLRLWLTAQHAGDDEVLDILVATTEAFNNAVLHASQPRSIAVNVEAVNNHGVIEILVRDHGGWQGHQTSAGPGLGSNLMQALMDEVDVHTAQGGRTVRLQRTVGPPQIAASESAIAPARERLDLLWRNPIFAPLPAATRERLATQLVPVSASTGETIIREGDHADRFYLIAEGQLDVSTGGIHIATLVPADHFGEIALLRNVPRTATIIAARPVKLYALTPEDFLTGITSRRASTLAAEDSAASRLNELQHLLTGTA